MGTPGERPAPVPPAELTGAVVGRFRVGARLGTGGMGEVYAAEDTTLKRTVALKRVSPARRGDAQSLERILREAERASALNHPCVASIYDVFQHGEDVFLVMEYVHGVSLRARMTARIPVHEVIPIAIQCAQALAAAHEKGIVHRDIRPENIMLTANGQVKL